MLRKLDWELDELRTDSGYPNGQRVGYRAFNCAVTAWQLVDWVWEDLSDAQRRALGNGTDARDLGEYCKRTNADLEICESIANASKHRKRRPKQLNPAVRCRMVTEVHHFSVGDPVGELLTSWKWEATILHYGVEHRAVDVFGRAYAFWRDFMAQRGLLPD